MYTNKQIWSVSYPILLSLLAQNVINVTDTAFLGHVSEVALGASAMGGLFYICVFTIAFGFSTGSQIVIARRNGEGRYTDVGPVMIQGVMFLFVMALLLFGFTKAFGGNIMRLLVSSESIYKGTMEFLDWRIYGFFFSFINVMFRALYIGITRTKVLTINAVVMALKNETTGIQVRFYTETKSQPVRTDTARLTQMILSTLVYPHEYQQDQKQERVIRFILSRKDEMLHFQIINSPLADTTFVSQETVIRHEINQLLLTHFGGTYQINTQTPEGPEIVFTYPIASDSE